MIDHCAEHAEYDAGCRGCLRAWLDRPPPFDEWPRSYVELVDHAPSPPVADPAFFPWLECEKSARENAAPWMLTKLEGQPQLVAAELTDATARRTARLNVARRAERDHRGQLEAERLAELARRMKAGEPIPDGTESTPPDAQG